MNCWKKVSFWSICHSCFLERIKFPFWNSFPRKVREVTPLTFGNKKRRGKKVICILLQHWHPLVDGIVLQLKYVKKLPYSLFREMEKTLPQYMAIHLTPNRYLNRSAEFHLRCHLSPLALKGALGIWVTLDCQEVNSIQWIPVSWPLALYPGPCFLQPACPCS